MGSRINQLGCLFRHASLQCFLTTIPFAAALPKKCRQRAVVGNFVAERRHSSVTRHAERSQRARAQRISSHQRAGGTPLQMRRSAYLCQRRLPISRGTGTIGLEYINVFNNIPLTENLQNQTKIRINRQISTPIQIRANYRANIKC